MYMWRNFGYVVAEYGGNRHTDTKLILLTTWSVGKGNDNQSINQSLCACRYRLLWLHCPALCIESLRLTYMGIAVASLSNL